MTAAPDLAPTVRQLAAALQQRGWLMATAESCTGGLIAGALTEVPGSSDGFDRGFVTYSNAAKMQMLGVPAATLTTYGAVSRQTAEAMAQGAAAHAQATVAVSVTGVAGPGGTENKPEGRVCFGIADEHGTRTETVDFGPLGRDGVRRATTAHALRMMIEELG